MPSMSAVRARPEWQFFGVLWTASRGKAAAWWAVLVLQGAMPGLLAIATGVVVATVRDGRDLTWPLTAVGVLFVLAQVLPPLLQAVSAVLGVVAADWLNDRLMQASVGPPGMAHLESPELATDLATARDFDLGRGGPPLRIAMEFIALGLSRLVTGVVSAAILLGFSWWAPLVLLAVWGSTHWLLRESGVWKDRNTPEVRDAQRHAAYAYDLAVEPPAAKELRLFGLAGWVVDRFGARRQRLFELQYRATRLRERPLATGLLVVARRQRAGLLGSRRRRPRRDHRHRRRDDLPAGGRRCQRGRVRRAELGDRHRRRAGGDDAAAAGGDGPGRCPGLGHDASCRRAPPPSSGCATSRSATATGRPCSTTST